MGASTAAHQIEGNNVNSDWWAAASTPARLHLCRAQRRRLRQLPPVARGHRLLAGLGLTTTASASSGAASSRSTGEFSRASPDHYRRMIDGCLDRGLTPIVTLTTSPFRAGSHGDGGWLGPEAVERFARFTEAVRADPRDRRRVRLPRSTSRTSGRAAGALQDGTPRRARSTGLPTPDQAVGDALVAAAPPCRARCVRDRRAVRRSGWRSPTRAFVRGRGPRSGRRSSTTPGRTGSCEGARGDDFSACRSTPARIGPDGPSRPTPTARRTTARRLGVPPAGARRAGHAAPLSHAPGVPILVTENGIATRDDTRRIAFLRRGPARLVPPSPAASMSAATCTGACSTTTSGGHREPTFGLIVGRPRDLRAHGQAQRPAARPDRPRQRAHPMSGFPAAPCTSLSNGIDRCRPPNELVHRLPMC